MIKKLNEIFEIIIFIFFPRRCAVCDSLIGRKELVCEKCKSNIYTIQGPTCMKCGKKVKQDEKMYCFDCSRKKHEFERGFAVFEYQDIKGSLYRFKYAGRAEYAAYYAQKTVEVLGETIRGLNPDALIPIPLHKKRMRKRGYNQAQEYSVELSKRLQIPTISHFVIREKNTIPLKKLSNEQRQNNLKKAFKISQNDVKLKTIIIIDDIYTTGATIDTVSKICKEAGVRKVYFLSISIGKGL